MTITPRLDCLDRLDDERLAELVGAGHAGAYEALHRRYRAPLLEHCRLLLGNRDDAEDVLQLVFLRVHRALAQGRAPEILRPWLFAVARNRCASMLAARSRIAVASEGVERGDDGLVIRVERRAQLRELLEDLTLLPDAQRAALLLTAFGGYSHAEVALAIGCPASKVRALVFQARATLLAERDARLAPCERIRAELRTARAGVLRRAPLRRHLRHCPACAAYAAPAAAVARYCAGEIPRRRLNAVERANGLL